MYSDTSSLYSHIDTDNDADKTYKNTDTDKNTDKNTDKDTDIDLILECYTYQTYLQLPLKQHQIKTLHKKWIGQIEQIKTIKKKSIIKSFYDLLTK